MFYGTYSPRAETESCWSDTISIIAQRVEGIEGNVTSPCAQQATTDIGLCDACYEATTGKAAIKAAPLVPVMYEPFVNDLEPIPY